jgi:hypothetical protein
MSKAITAARTISREADPLLSANPAAHANGPPRAQCAVTALPRLTLVRAPQDKGAGNGYYMEICTSRLCLSFFTVLITALAAVIPARPHTHVDPDGRRITWYPTECCHNRDCKPVASIKRARNGLWMTTADGFTVLIGPNEPRRPSKDMRWHLCVGPGDMDDAGPQIYCIFEPPNS